MLNSGMVNLADKNAFLAGTSFPDIRNTTPDVSRATTHHSNARGLPPVLSAKTPFEAGRLFHVFIDREREKHMREHNAYRFLGNGPLRTQLLKIIEDHILFEKFMTRSAIIPSVNQI
jgi:hypothetical protein